MKILKIEMENLNSLKGYWCIDFEHPDYKKNYNLFVICGETGSGKTTILDAITLALYGETPRQPKFGEINEIMTRHTASCMARVTYSCRKGKFVSEFSQSKARGNINGRLQSASGIITDLQTGESSGSLSVKRLKEETEKIIQLDYDQFLRSILLAQGEFDTFLQGTPRQRADILSKLNGTAHYKDFAVYAWTAAADKKRKWEELRDECEAIKLLTDEEIESKNSSIKDGHKTVEKDRQISQNAEDALQWLKKVSNLKVKKEQAQKERESYEDEKRGFEAKELILKRAEKALNCKGEYERWKKLSEDYKRDGESLASQKKNLEELCDTLKTKEEKTQALKEDFENIEKEAEKKGELYKKVRALDSEIKAKKELCDILYSAKESNDASLKKAQEDLSLYKDIIEKKSEEVQRCSEYLEEHKDDKELEGVTASVIEQFKKLLSFTQNITKAAENIKTSEEELEEIQSEKNKATDDRSNAESDLKEYVSTNYKSVTRLLREGLKEGEACPVCLSLIHPVKAISGGHEISSDSTELRDTAKVIAELDSLILELDKKINTLQSQASSCEATLNGFKQSLNELKKDEKECLDEVNDILKKWGKSADKGSDRSSLLNIVNDLKNLSKSYKDASEKKEKCESEAEKAQEFIKGIDIDAITQKTDESTKDYEKAFDLYNGIKNEREELFGQKDVDEDETAFAKKRADSADLYNKERDSKAELEKSIAAAEGSVEQLENRVKSEESEVKKAFDALGEVITSNGFTGISDYEESLLSQDVIEGYKSQKSSLEKRDGQTLSLLHNTEKEYEECASLKVTDKDENELIKIKDEVQTHSEEVLQQIGKIKNELEANEKNAGEYKSRLTLLNEGEKQYRMWDQIQKLLGVKSGENFQEFVEALAFKRLLQIANVYVFAISGRYTLVQKTGEVDFLIHDENYPDSKDDRSVSNLSGGEKFIVSLSLALGIAELASHNVKVDSLFLDEGFGTLSGQPLIEAVNALKSLQAKGKMLGIITHIDSVINEFDQKITAKKKNGGISELSGSGITGLK